MPRSPRSNARNQPLFTSQKDRLGAILLFLGVLTFWLLSEKQGKMANLPIEANETAFKIEPKKLATMGQPKPSKQQEKYRVPEKISSKKSAWHKASLTKWAANPSPWKKKWTLSYPEYHKRKTPSLIPINLSDSADWEGLPGIGPVLASRIIRYRNRLGGFYAAEQLREVYGLADSVIDRISPYLQMDSTVLQKININKVSLEELRSHPYLKGEFAKAIIVYREAHGPFHRSDQLHEIWNLSLDLIAKIRPYLNFTEEIGSQ